jgi:hypothetical protein
VVGEGLVASPGGKGLPSKEVRMGLEVGGLRLGEVQAFAFDQSGLYRDPNPPRGVLSPKLFSGYLVTLDYPRDRLVIREGELPEPDGTAVFAYDSRHRLPVVPITLAGHRFEVFLDSGAAGGVLLPLSFAERLPLAAKPAEVGRGRRVDQEVVIYGAKLRGQFKLGRHVEEDPEIRFDTVAPRGHVGNAVLRRFALTLDCKNRRVGLEDSSGGHG